MIVVVCLFYFVFIWVLFISLVINQTGILMFLNSNMVFEVYVWLNWGYMNIHVKVWTFQALFLCPQALNSHNFQKAAMYNICHGQTVNYPLSILFYFCFLCSCTYWCSAAPWICCLFVSCLAADNWIHSLDFSASFFQGYVDKYVKA